MGIEDTIVPRSADVAGVLLLLRNVDVALFNSYVLGTELADI